MLDQLAGEILGRALRGARLTDPFFADIQTWIASLVSTAPARWRAIAVSGIKCGCKANAAIGACVACATPTCLQHAFVSGQAHIICGNCVQSMASNKAAPPEPTRETIRAAHMKVLGLKDPFTREELKSAFRSAATKAHPDRAKEGRREAAEKKMVKVNLAFQWLDKEFEDANARQV